MRLFQAFLLASAAATTFLGCAVQHDGATEEATETAEDAVTLAALYGTWQGEGGKFITLSFTTDKAETLGGYMKGRRFEATIDTGIRCITTPCPSSIEASGVYKTTSGVKLTLNSYDKPSREFGAVLGDYSMKQSGDKLTLTKSDDKTVVESFHRVKLHTDKEVVAAAEAHAWPSRDKGYVYRLFDTRAAAEAFGNTHGNSRWIGRDGETATTSRFVSGFNDLWAEEFTVDKASLAITVTGEH